MKESTVSSLPITRRWMGEFAVIVAGVSVALAAESAWGRWQDTRAEQTYITQLQSDLAENTSRLEAAIRLETQQREAAQAAYHAVARGEAISRDSAVTWLINRRGVFYSDPRLVTGTIAALVSTGDLRLLRNPALRQAVAAYSTQISEDRQEFDRFVERFLVPFDVMRNLGFENAHELDSRVQFAAVVASITGNPRPGALAALDGILLANDVRIIYLRRMLETTQRLRALVGADA